MRFSFLFYTVTGLTMKCIIVFILVLFLQFSLNANPVWDDFPQTTEKADTELRIFPNPVRNEKVTLTLHPSEITEIKVVNIAGKEVIKKKFTIPLKKTTLQLSDVPNGIYIIQVKTSDNGVIAQKLIVSRN